ncbi:MAG: PAS domain S-box protein, partial [Candidatus Bathyarchaeia archaeon]
HLRGFLRGISDIDMLLVALDENGRVASASRGLRRLLGVEESEISGMDWFENFIPEGRREEARRSFQSLLSGGYLSRYEAPLTLRDGREELISWSSTALRDEEGRLLYALSFGDRLSERARAGEELELAHTLLDNISEWIVVSDEDYRIIYMNRAAKEVYGDGVGEKCFKVYQGYDEPCHLKGWPCSHLEIIIRGRREYTYTAKDSKGRWLEVLAFPMKVAGDNPLLVEIVRDITEKVEAEEKLRDYSRRLEEMVDERTRGLREVESKFRGLYDSIRDGILCNDLSGRILECNKAFEEMVGYTLEELRGMRWQDITPKEYLELEEGIIKEEMIRKGRSGYLVKEYIRKDGSRIPIEVTGSIVKGENGKPDVIWCIVRDISERKRLEKALLEAERMAAVGSLAAQVGHDLRNPLTSISNAAYYLKMKLKDGSEKVKRMIEIILREVDYADKILRDLLDFSKPLKPKFAPANITEVLEATLSSMAKPRGIEVERRFKPVPEASLDPDMLKRAFSNIIQNAYEAMPKGGKLTVEAEALQDAVKVSFQDTGHGIPEGDLEKIFQPLFTTKAKGLGLGLATAKRIIEAHGGEITVESKPGEGSKFTVKLPLKPYPQTITEERRIENAKIDRCIL